MLYFNSTYILRIDYEGNRKMFFYNWNSLYLPFKYGWVFDSFKSSANSTPSSTGHLLRALLHEYLGWGKTLFPQGTLPKKKKNKKAKREIEGCFFNMAPCKTARLCKVNTGRCYSWFTVTEHWYFHPVWWIILGSHSWGCTGFGCSMQTCCSRESALTNEQNSKKKTRSDSSLILNGVT